MDLALHIGAHRTATTSLQQGLRKADGILAAAGVAFWGPETMRRPGRGDHARNLRRAATDAAAASAAAAAREAAARDIAAQAAAGRRLLLISEENLLGTMEGNFAAAALYPNAARNLAAARDLLGRAPDAVFLALRDYAGYWASAYAHCVLLREMPPFDGPALAASARGWPEVVADVAAVFPDAHVTVWQHGPGAAGAALAAMLPGALGGAVALPRRQANAALTARGLDRFAALRRRSGPFDAAARRAAVTELRAVGGPPFRPFSKAEQRLLDARYRDDWRAVATMGVRVLTPEEAAR